MIFGGTMAYDSKRRQKIALREVYVAELATPLFAPKFGKKNAGTRSFMDCVIKKSIRYESVSADLDAMSESAIL